MPTATTHVNGHHNRLHDLTISAPTPPPHDAAADASKPGEDPGRVNPPNADNPSGSSFILPPSSFPASLVLRFFLDGSMSLLDVCEHAEVSLEELEAWANSESAQKSFATIRRLAALRDELILADAVPQARQTLTHLATIADPAESASSRDCRRKSANALIAQWNARSSPSLRGRCRESSSGGGGAPSPAPRGGGGRVREAGGGDHVARTSTRLGPRRAASEPDAQARASSHTRSSPAPAAPPLSKARSNPP